MPTERFYRLSKEKQQSIYEAAKNEFARVPYEATSINQIVRNAKISRGSFYTYFENKEDAMLYVMRENYLQMRSLCENTLDQNGGEYLGMLKVLFDYFIEKMQSTKEIMAIIDNVLGQKEEEDFSQYAEGFFEKTKEKKGEEPMSWLLARVNRSKLRVKTKDELTSMVVLGQNALYSSLRQYYQRPEKLADIRNLFNAKLDIISKGAYQYQAAE